MTPSRPSPASSQARSGARVILRLRVRALCFLVALSAALTGAAGLLGTAPPWATPARAAEKSDEAALAARLLDNPSRAAFRHHALDVVIDPDTGELTATDNITVVHAPQSSRPLSFLLHRDLQIDHIRLHGLEPRPHPAGIPLVTSEQTRWDPRLFWARPDYPELASLDHARQIELRLADSSAHWPDSALLAVSYRGVVYDSLKPPPENYQRGFETTDGLIDPRGAFLAGGTLWYPQRFDEPAPFTLRVTAPDGWESVSQGRRVPGPASGGWPSVTWICEQPMDEIYLVAGPYKLREELHDGVAVQTFTYGHQDEELCRRYIDATKDYLDLYSERIGPYPFAKFALVENFWQTGYGMPSFTLLGDRVIRLPFIVHTSYGHEILHNWWGNGVFVDYESGNWCEGLTVYGADYLYKERESAAAARDYRRTSLQAYLDYVGAGRDFPLTEFRSRHDASSAAVGYNKAMMIYHMLRQQLGDDAFWAVLQEFYDRYRFARADWMDLLTLFAERGGFDAERFYAQWVARTGAPLLSLEATDVTPLPPPTGAAPAAANEAPADRYRLRYRIVQSEPHYDLHVPLRLSFADRPAREWTVPLTAGAYEATLELSAYPQALSVDPDFDLFRRLHRAEVPTALSQLFGADSVTAVIASALAPPLATACEDLAAQSARGKPTGVRRDADLVAADLERGAVWFFGEPAWIERLQPTLPAEVVITDGAVEIAGQRFARDAHTIVLTAPHPVARDQACGYILGGDAEDLPAIWRKLPHYGKYSYLVFSGATNVAKGSWTPGRSPLRVVWAEAP